MADAARLNAGIVPRVLASWQRPGQVVRALHPMTEGAMLAILMGAMLVFLIAQAPGHARYAAMDPSIPLGGRIAGAIMALFFLMPLAAYAVAAIVSVISRIGRRRIAPEASRLALFWALLAVSPAMLLSGLIEGFIGPGAALTVLRAISGLGFLFIWGAGLVSLAERI
ncbi:hypothetical protein [Paracoccus sediminicola]|uniref:hypothetical protein n=1 Tax=Paracoccus sediminicola TaxID=3017783 RepID=UPI0022F10365|nr:hypothetical protein [Paracoccus sediminicola]WBU55822.1 hypothetical protein PAF18_09935 [Paracoccus sediminicola]